MNRVEHLLTCLSEECAEVQQAVSKALRFGLDDKWPEKIETPAQDIVRECIDAIAIIEMLEEEGIIKIGNMKEPIKQKKDKVLHYMEYAKKKGTLI